jgi:hypothetical protein
MRRTRWPPSSTKAFAEVLEAVAQRAEHALEQAEAVAVDLREIRHKAATIAVRERHGRERSTPPPMSFGTPWLRIWRRRLIWKRRRRWHDGGDNV